MKKYLLLCFLFFSLKIFSQSCQSLRYQQPVFSSYIKTTEKFGNADPYGLLSGQDLFMDIYQPMNDTLSKRPTVIYVFGGGFLIGTKDEPPIAYYADYFTKLGYVFISIDYRLGFNVTTPGSPDRAVYRSVQDLRSAERYLSDNCSLLRIDTSKYILMGSSAGCFAGLHSTYMEYSQAVAFRTPIPVLDPENLGGIDSSGNTNYQFKYTPPFAIVNLWGALVDTNFIDADEKFPVISFHGDQDNAVPYVYGYPFSYPVFPNVFGSKPIHRRLNTIGAPNKLYTLVGRGHEPELTELGLRDTILQNAAPFLYDLLKPKTSAISGLSEACSGSVLTYSVVNTLGSKYCWTVSGPVNILQNLNNSIRVQVIDSGTVQVSVREMTYNDATDDTKYFTTVVYKQPIANLSIQVDTELSIQITNQSQFGISHWLNMGNGTTLTSVPTNYSFSQPGTYHIEYILSDHICKDTAFATVSVDTCPSAFFTTTVQNNVVNIYPQLTNTTTYYWDFGDGQTLSANGNGIIHFYNTDGSYIIHLNVSNALGCEAFFTDTVNIQTTGIEEKPKSNLQIYPNPVKDFVWIKDGHSSEKKMFRITNCLGEMVQEFASNGQETQKVNLQHLADGVYFLKTENQVFRLILKK